jgi:HEPN domain-containing protein
MLSVCKLVFHRDPVTYAACFHCQQAVEKSLKAFLVDNGISFKKVYSLSFSAAERN